MPDGSTATITLTRNNDEWRNVLEQFYSQYSVFGNKADNDGDSSNFIAAAVSSDASAIESSMSYRARQLERKFSPAQVDLLLNQTADLLDRCVRDRAELEDARRRGIGLLLEVIEFVRNDAILADEIKAHKFELPAERSSLEVAARTAEEMHLDAAAKLVKSELDDWYSQNAIDDHISTVKASDYAGHMPYFRPQDPVTPLEWYFEGGHLQNLPEFAGPITEKLAKRTVALEKSSVSAQDEITRKDFEVAQNMKASAIKQNNWDTANIEFQRRKLQIARDLIDFKIRLACLDGGPFNFAQIAKRLNDQIERDFNDSLMRIQAIADGLKLVYGQPSNFPPPLQKFMDGRDHATELPLGLMDACLIWVRNTIAWLIRFSHSEQNFSVSLSLRHLMGEEKWAAARQDGRYSFEVPTSYLGDHFAFPRLRGVNVFVDVGVELRKLYPFIASLTPPKTASTKYADGTWTRINQHDTSEFSVGKLMRRSDIHDPETGGSRVLNNVSPFGQWEVHLRSRDRLQDDTVSVEDIEIDLLLSAQRLS